MSNLTEQEEITRYNPHENAGGGLYRAKHEQDEFDKLTSASHQAKSATDSHRKSNQPVRHKGKPVKRWQLLTNKKLRGGSSLLAVILVLFGGAGFLTVFSAPTLAIVQLKEVLTQDLNDQVKAFDTRSAMHLRSKLKDTTKGSCGAVKIACKFATMSDRQVKKFANAGIVIDRNMSTSILPKRGQATRFTFTDPETKQKIYATSAEQLHDLTMNNVMVRAQMTKAYNPIFVSMSDGVSRAALRIFGAGKGAKISGETDEERRKSINTAVGEGEQLSAKDLVPEKDSQGKETGNYLGPDGEVLSPEQVAAINDSGALASEATKIAPSKIVSAVGKTLMITSIADNACTASNAMRMVAGVAKIKREAQAARFATAALLIPADQIKAGDADQSTTTFVGDMINGTNQPSPPEKIVDESKLDQPGSLQNPPMINNPELHTTAFDGAGPKASMYGDVPKLTTSEASLSLAGGFIGTLSKINSYIAMAVTGGNPDPREIGKRCKFIQNNYVRGASLVAGILIGAGTFGLATAAGIAGSLLLGMAVPYAMSIAADIAAGGAYKNLSGKTFGTAAFAGTSSTLGKMAQLRGMKPLTSREAVAYTGETQETYRQYNETERYLARATPLDIYNQYSLLGSIATVVAPFARHSSASAGVMALSLPRFFSASFAVLTPTAKAANPQARFEQCPDAGYQTLGIGADILCNVRYGLSQEELDMDPIENATWMAQSGNIDPNSENGDAKDNDQKWNYKKFIKECAQRTAGWGENQTENGEDGTNCLSAENEPLNQHFRVYHFDLSISKAMDEEDSNDTLGSGDGSRGTPGANGWTYPTTPDATVTSGFHDPGRGGDHDGVDLAQPGGALNKPIYAARGGKVTHAGPASGFGNWIIIEHQVDGKTYSTLYGHMYDDGVLVKVGDEVKAGQQIGKIGSNGWSTGPHLHFEVWDGGYGNGSAVDPMQYIHSPEAARNA